MLDFMAFDSDHVEILDVEITANYVPMWKHVGICNLLYNSTGKKLSAITEKLKIALDYMKDNEEIFRAMEPKNKWGTYEGAIEILSNIVDAGNNCPDAKIHSF